MKQTVKDFLDRHSIDPAMFNVDEISALIIKEMEKGLKGEKSSLKMINSYCNPSDRIVKNENILVIDAGGTNFRTCIVHFTEEGQPVIEDFKKSRMPGSDGEVSSEDFFRIIADETQRLIHKADKIGFCFSYPAQILPDHDGIPLLLSKEIKASQVLGKHLGKELLAEFSRRNIDVSKKKIIILNDTVTTLLAGLSKTEELECEGCVGFILGTGTNTAYMEKGTIINEESGGFEYAPGDIDRSFISGTANPNVQFFEKLISGVYLGPLALEILKVAKAENVICADIPASFTTKDLGDTLDAQNLNPDVMDILNAYIERVAVFAAANLCASVIKSGYGKNKPCLINADGTTFYKTGKLDRLTVQYTEKTLALHGLKARFVNIDNSPVIGSAIGALSL